MKKLVSAVFLAVALSAGAQGTSQEAILDSASTIGGAATGTVGWTFRSNGEVSITQLGAYTNLVITQGPMNVGVWSSGGTLLRSVTVDTTSSVQNRTFYSSVEPLWLLPLETYHIGLFVASGNQILTSFFDPDQVGTGSVSVSGLITVVGLAESTSGFTFPAAVTGGQGAMWLGPNAVLQGVPEPSGLALLGLAGFASLLWRKRVGR